MRNKTVFFEVLVAPMTVSRSDRHRAGRIRDCRKWNAPEGGRQEVGARLDDGDTALDLGDAVRWYQVGLVKYDEVGMYNLFHRRIRFEKAEPVVGAVDYRQHRLQHGSSPKIGLEEAQANWHR